MRSNTADIEGGQIDILVTREDILEKTREGSNVKSFKIAVMAEYIENIKVRDNTVVGLVVRLLDEPGNLVDLSYHCSRIQQPRELQLWIMFLIEYKIQNNG